MKKLGRNPYSMNKSENWIANIPNDGSARERIEFFKKYVKDVFGNNFRLVVRGRHSDRKGLFKKIGRPYCDWMASQNDFNSDEFHMCEYFSLYRRTK